MKNNPVNIMWFRRDLRLSDNQALMQACLGDKDVVPIFIFDENILNKLKDKEDKRVTFIWESLSCLQSQLSKKNKKILILKGKPKEVISSLLKRLNVIEVHCNEDYEPYAIKRDKLIGDLCSKQGVSFFSHKDQVVFRGDEVLKADKTPYKVFTPYKNCWLSQLSPNDLRIYKPNLKKLSILNLKSEVSKLSQINFKQVELSSAGGERIAKKILKDFLKRINRYDSERDFIAKDSNSHLSPYIRFGCISIRELVRSSYFIETPGAKVWLSELIWREFYQMILYNFPEVVELEFVAKYRKIKWLGKKSHLKKWKDGKTGFPIIDAAMIHFAKTGQMHNRLRMVVASFLIKDLLIDWREGEKYFAEKLLDFDLASNNGGWQWCASTGCDAQPYFRIFNPYSQSKRFDPDGSFIKKHLPQLKNFSSKHIHAPGLSKLDVQEKAGCIIGKDYPLPIVDHSEQRLLAIDMFKKI